MTDSPISGLSPAEKLKSLYALHVALGGVEGYESRLVTHRPEKPILAVRNSKHKDLNEAITVVEEAGVRWFVWSWDERMVPVGQVQEAARRVMHVITPQRERPVKPQRSRM